MATKFRIQTNGSTFRVQYRKAFNLFWRTFDDDLDRGETPRNSFTTVEDAEAFIRSKKQDMDGCEWKVIKRKVK